jgi:hypothetical protein
MSTQLPMDIPAVAKWYEAVERHMDHCKATDECGGCKTLQKRMTALRVRYASQLVKI